MAKYHNRYHPPLSSFDKKENIRKSIVLHCVESEIGVSHNMLAGIIGIDRSNLRPYMRDLIAEGFVTRGPGKFGWYYATKKARNQDIFFSLVGLELRRLLSNEPFDLSNGQRRSMVKFVNLVGGLITYTIIQSLNPNNPFISKIGDRRNKNSFPLNHMRLRSVWVERIVSEVVSGIALVYKFNRDVLEDDLDLVKDFQILYPSLYSELSTLWSNLKDLVDGEKMGNRRLGMRKS